MRQQRKSHRRRRSRRGGRRFLGVEIRANQSIQSFVERPGRRESTVGGRNPSLLDLVLLLNGVDAILALDVCAVRLLGVAMERVDGVGDVLPVLLAEVAAVELEVASAPGVHERGRGLLGPAVLADGDGPRRRRDGVVEVGHRKTEIRVRGRRERKREGMRKEKEERESETARRKSGKGGG